jgi:hypothetical protein
MFATGANVVDGSFQSDVSYASKMIQVASSKQQGLES